MNMMPSDKISQDSRKLGKTWTCPQCSDVLERVISADLEYESDADFLLTIIDHVTTHLTWG